MKSNLIIAILLLFIISCKKKQESTHPLVGDITESVYASGIIKSQHQYQVYSTVSGTINAILVEEGNYVKKGSPLLSITNISSKLLTENAKLAVAYNSESNITYKLDQLNKNIDLAKSKMQNDSLLWQRQKNLYASQVGSLNQLEQRELQYKSSFTAFETAILNYNDVKKQLALTSKQSKNVLEINQTQQNDFTIKSETDGLVYLILKEKGEMVTPQMPIAVIGDSANFILELQVDEYDITKLKIGQHAFVSLDSYKGQVFEATVTKMDLIMNDRTRSFTVEAIFINRPQRLYPNLTVEANIIIQKKSNALIIPRNYLINDSMVLNEKNENIKVVLGLMDLEKAEVISGLSEKDKILKPVK